MAIDLLYYVQQCAPKVAPSTMLAIIRTESRGNHLALNLNKVHRLLYQPKNLRQALAWVEYLDLHGYNFDVGLGQINISNIRKYGYKPADMLDPCKNLRVASDILYKNYHKALNRANSKHHALHQALSVYNTGSYQRGFSNGYVQRVLVNGGAAISQTQHRMRKTKIKTKSTPNKSLIYAKPKNNSK
jgi:type IV secretion system protein VirB1